MKIVQRAYYQNKSLRRIYKSTEWLRKPFSSQKLKDQDDVINNLILLMREDPLLSINEFEGTFFFDVRSHLFKRLVLDKYYEPELSRLCSFYVNPKKDVIDVGANIGLFTVLLAKNIDSSQKVLAIEPTQNASLRLLRNIERNHVREKVNLFRGVASNSSSTVDIQTIVGKEEYSSLGNILHPALDDEQYVTERVESKTIDDLVTINLVKPGFIKVDVEGCEHLVFKGAQATLQEHRPIIISELSDFLLNKNGSSAQEVIQLIEHNDYDIFDPISPWNQPGLKEFGDIICFPKELGISSAQINATIQK